MNSVERQRLRSTITEYARKHPVRNQQTARHTVGMKPEKLLSSAQGLTLSTSEKNQLRKALHNHIQAHPVADSTGYQINESDSQHYWLTVVKNVFFGGTVRLVPAIACVLIISSGIGGVSYAAESALPGDWLYPIKVEFTERLRSSLQFEDRTKADWYLKRMERRLGELELLAEKSQVESGVEENVLTRFNDHITKLQERIDGLQNSGDLEAAERMSLRLSSLLELHQGALENLSGEEANLAATLERIRQARHEAASAHNQYQTDFLANLNRFFGNHLIETRERLQAIDADDQDTKIEGIHVLNYLQQAEDSFKGGDQKRALHFARQARLKVLEMEKGL